jgi:hypothetical protein
VLLPRRRCQAHRRRLLPLPRALRRGHSGPCWDDVVQARLHPDRLQGQTVSRRRRHRRRLVIPQLGESADVPHHDTPGSCIRRATSVPAHAQSACASLGHAQAHTPLRSRHDVARPTSPRLFRARHQGVLRRRLGRIRGDPVKFLRIPRCVPGLLVVKTAAHRLPFQRGGRV